MKNLTLIQSKGIQFRSGQSQVLHLTLTSLASPDELHFLLPFSSRAFNCCALDCFRLSNVQVLEIQKRRLTLRFNEVYESLLVGFQDPRCKKVSQTQKDLNLSIKRLVLGLVSITDSIFMD